MKKIFRTIAFISCCLFLWASLKLVSLFYIETPNDNENYIPASSDFVIKINGENLTENTLFGILFESHDKELIKLIKNSLKSNKSTKYEFDNSGINVLSDIIVFNTQWENKQVKGLIFNLFDKEEFDKYMSNNATHEYVYAANEKVGILLSKKDIKDESKLKNYANQLVSQENKSKNHFFKQSKKTNSYAQLHLHKHFKESSTEINFDFSQQKQTFILQGDYSIAQTSEENDMKFALEPEDFHLTSTSFNQMLSDSLHNIFKSIQIEIPNIKSISLNYHGIDIVNHSMGYIPIPNMEMVLAFEDTCSVKKIINQFVSYYDFECELSNNQIKIEDKTLYFKQLNNNTFYIGRKEMPKFKALSSDHILSIKGDLNPLTEIKGGGFVSTYLSLMPQFQAAKKLANSTKSLELNIIKSSKDNAKIYGELKFKEDYKPINEVIRFILLSFN